MNAMTAVTAHKSADHSSKDLIENAAEASRILNLLGQEARFLALYYLSTHGEMTVTELVNVVGISQSALSHHLSKLRRDKIVTFRRDAHHLYYRLSDPRVSRLIHVFQPPYQATESARINFQIAASLPA
jgi:DNA-binding transcriptional ArsR family regulator